MPTGVPVSRYNMLDNGPNAFSFSRTAQICDFDGVFWLDEHGRCSVPTPIETKAPPTPVMDLETNYATVTEAPIRQEKALEEYAQTIIISYSEIPGGAVSSLKPSRGLAFLAGVLIMLFWLLPVAAAYPCSMEQFQTISERGTSPVMLKVYDKALGNCGMRSL